MPYEVTFIIKVCGLILVTCMYAVVGEQSHPFHCHGANEPLQRECGFKS